MNVVVTGASRGIGLELVRKAVAKGARVLAVARQPEKSEGLRQLAPTHEDKLEWLSADLSDFGAASRIAEALQAWDRVDVLINNAGIFRKGIAPEDFMQSFQVNSVSPFLVTKAVEPWLRKARTPKVAQITSMMGSIEDNSSGGYYAYRASKCALNMINKSLARDLNGVTAIVIHPGWVQTDMGGAGAPVLPVDSAAGIWEVIDRAQVENSGEFFDFRGKSLPW